MAELTVGSLVDCRNRMWEFQVEADKNGCWSVEIPYSLRKIVLKLHKTGYINIDDKGIISFNDTIEMKMKQTWTRAEVKELAKGVIG